MARQKRSTYNEWIAVVFYIVLFALFFFASYTGAPGSSRPRSSCEVFRYSNYETAPDLYFECLDDLRRP